MSANIALGLKRVGETHGNRPAVALGRTTLQSYGQLADRAARLAASLSDKLGLQPGDHVAIAAMLLGAGAQFEGVPMLLPLDMSSSIPESAVALGRSA